MFFLLVTTVTFITIMTVLFVFEVFLPLWNEQRPFVLWRMLRLRLKLAGARDEVTRAVLLQEIDGTKKEAAKLWS